MPMQKNIDIGGQLIGRNVLQTEFQSTAHEIDDQWPLEIAVAISAHVSDPGSNRAQLIENAFHTNISKMPDFVCTFSQLLHLLRQAIVRVRQDENAQRLFRLFLACHAPATLPLRCHLRLCPAHVDLCSGGCYVAPHLLPMSQNYKETLNLPRTEFPMKANLAGREPEMLKMWEETRLYQQIQKAREDRELFVLHDGPPFANGDVHMGTALNKILKVSW